MPESSRTGCHRSSRTLACALLAAAALAGCGRCGNGARSPVVGSFDGGEITADDVHREAMKLPPILRARVETDAGRHDLVSALIDKRLLAQEARRRKLDADPEIRRQVAELEERLVVQALLSAEEAAAGQPTEAELRSFHAAHSAELATPERVRIRRILAELAPGADAAERGRARGRAERFAARLRAGEAFEKVAGDGDGPERARGGDLGLVARDGRDPELEAAAFALREPGARSGVVAVRGGFAVLELVERRPAATPSFEDARAEVANRLEPQRKRKVFDGLLERLRTQSKVSIAIPVGPR